MKDESKNYLARNAPPLESNAKDLEEIDGDFESSLFEVQLAAHGLVSKFGGGSEQFLVRISGSVIQDGLITKALHDGLVAPLVSQLEFSSGTNQRNGIEFGLAGISRGSVVLHLEPVTGLRPDQANQLNLGTTIFQDSVQRIQNLHTSLESNVGLQEIKRHFGSSKALYRSIKRMSKYVSDHEITISSYWIDVHGQSSKGVFTRKGADYAHSLFLEMEDSEERVISGLVTSLDIGGTLTIQPGIGERKYLIHAPIEYLAGRSLTLGSRLSLRVRVDHKSDDFLISDKESFNFLEEIGGDPLF